MTSANIAILGCGYVGMAIARHWRDDGHRVTATTTSPERRPELEAVANAVQIVRGDNPDELRQLLQGQDTLLVSVASKGRQTYDAAYLQTARNLVSVLDNAPQLRQIIYTGSGGLYGDWNGGWVSETTPPQPTSRNYEILCQTEQVLLAAEGDDLAVCVMRLGGIYGPGREIAKIYGNLAGRTRPGDGSRPSNWIHLDDIVGAIAFARDRRLRGIYNLVDDDYQPTRDLVARVCDTYDLPPVTWDPSQSETVRYNAKLSNQKIKDAGYQLIHPERII